MPERDNEERGATGSSERSFLLLQPMGMALSVAHLQFVCEIVQHSLGSFQATHDTALLPRQGTQHGAVLRSGLPPRVRGGQRARGNAHGAEQARSAVGACCWPIGRGRNRRCSQRPEVVEEMRAHGMEVPRAGERPRDGECPISLEVRVVWCERSRRQRGCTRSPSNSAPPRHADTRSAQTASFSTGRAHAR
jgi:hypothetical protein